MASLSQLASTAPTIPCTVKNIRNIFYSQKARFSAMSSMSDYNAIVVVCFLLLLVKASVGFLFTIQYQNSHYCYYFCNRSNRVQSFLVRVDSRFYGHGMRQWSIRVLLSSCYVLLSNASWNGLVVSLCFFHFFLIFFISLSVHRIRCNSSLCLQFAPVVFFPYLALFFQFGGFEVIFEHINKKNVTEKNLISEHSLQRQQSSEGDSFSAFVIFVFCLKKKQ